MIEITNVVDIGGQVVYCPFNRSKCRNDCAFFIDSDTKSNKYFCALAPNLNGYHKWLSIQKQEIESPKFKSSGN